MSNETLFNFGGDRFFEGVRLVLLGVVVAGTVNGGNEISGAVACGISSVYSFSMLLGTKASRMSLKKPISKYPCFYRNLSYRFTYEC